jgi:DNA-directed RNA polymerase
MLEEEGKLDGTVPKRKARTTTKRRDKENPLSRFHTTVIWTTPLRLPVVQPYREPKIRQVATSLQKFNIREPQATDPVSRRKQLQAFPPNFIHSLDATHMFLSAIKCDELGLTFSAVHDSFWTHAGTVDTMNRVLRDEFIRMHSEDVVGRLFAEFKARYSNHLYLARVRHKTPLWEKIKAHRKKNGVSYAKITELVTEYKRLKLLSSDDPAEQKQGLEMVTAGSLFAAEPNAEDMLVTTRSLGVAGMGEVSPQETALAASADGTVDEASLREVVGEALCDQMAAALDPELGDVF